MPLHASNSCRNPSRSHLDNLRNDTKYMTSWISAGWSEYFPCSLYHLLITNIYLANNVMTYVSSFFPTLQRCLKIPRETLFILQC